MDTADKMKARRPMRMPQRFAPRLLGALVAVACAIAALAGVPVSALAEGSGSGPVGIYQTLDELKGKRFAYINGSVYNQAVAEKVEGTQEQFYASLADCVAAVEGGKADAAVQLSYGLELVVNRRGGTVALLPETVGPAGEAFFFPHGSPLVAEFDKAIDKFEADGTIERLRNKWVSADDSQKTLPEQDWDAPNGTLKFATSGVLEPYSYVGKSGEPLGYDVELALNIARELGYRLEVSAIPMDSIIASAQAGKVDFGGTLTKTPERAEKVDFSKQVMPSYIAVLVKAQEGSPAAPKLEYSSIDQLEGKTIGILNGTILAQVIDAKVGGTHEYAYYNSVGDQVAALKSGKIDAFAADDPIALLCVNNNEGIGIVPGTVMDDYYGFIFPKGSALRAEFDKVIERLRADGTLDELKRKWTGSDEAAKTLPEQGWATPKGTLTMGTSAILEPLTYQRGQDVVGYDIELAMLICKELGYGLEIVNQEFTGNIAGVEAGKYDFGCGGISITDERKERMDFSVPYYQSSPLFVVRLDGSTAETDFVTSLADSFRKTFIEEDRWKLIADGLGVTVIISVCSGALGALLGYATVLARRSGRRWLERLVGAYQAVMGGVPLVVVLMVIYYVVFGSLDVPGVPVAILAFTLAFGSTAGSTMWTAVAGIDQIQEETGLALGYTHRQVFAKIVFPQARQQFAPQLAGQFVSLVKDTAVVGYIAVQDLARASDLIRARTMDAFFPLIATAVIYFLICRVLAWVLARLVERLDPARRPREIEGVISSKKVRA